MRQETFAILFLMRKGRPKKNGLAPIFARITTGGLRQEVYTQCDSNPETWNQHKERAMGTNKLAIQVNERLNDFRVKIIDIRTKLLAEGYAANAAQIKQRYLNPTCNTMMLIAGLADYAKRRQGEVGVRITQRTADKYERLLRYLKQYLAQRGKAEDIPVERMNYEFLDGFNLFLQTAHRWRHNGAACLARGRVLPTPSNQKMNAYMKEIAAVCGIDKVLTTHCARHTFACMAVEYGMPIDVLAKILGHSNTNMTRHYAKFSETVIGRAMEAFGERLASAASAE